VAAGQTRRERETGILHRLTVERAGLENEMLRTQIRAALQTGPPMPSALDAAIIPGQGNAISMASPHGGFPTLNVQPMRVNPSAPNRMHHETAAVADSGFARTETGLAPVPSLDVKERIEDQIIPEMMWALRNQIMPFLTRPGMDPRSKSAPNLKQFPLPPGMYWRWHRWANEWRPAKIGAHTARPKRGPLPSTGFGDVFTGS